MLLVGLSSSKGVQILFQPCNVTKKGGGVHVRLALIIERPAKIMLHDKTKELNNKLGF